MKYRKRFPVAAAQTQPFPEKRTADGRALLAMIAALAVGGLATASVYLLSQNATESDGLLTSASCHDYNGLPIASGDTPAGMVQIPAGEFVMGNNRGHRDLGSGRFQPYPEERQAHVQKVAAFWMDQHEVTNAQFASFVSATGYQTLAEQTPDSSWFPAGTPAAQQQPGAAVFTMPNGDIKSAQPAGRESGQKSGRKSGWNWQPGAYWRQPEGPGSSIEDRMNHPVVHITLADAKAYAKWLGNRLPTEAEWEYAARGNRIDEPYPWGKTLLKEQQWMANTWQGAFPIENPANDGHQGRAPVGCYPPNAYGLYDVAGNVWELVADAYRPHHQAPAISLEEAGHHVIKGGSYLCAPNYCMRYRPAARQRHELYLGTSHIGFRTVRSITQ